jgi:signal transduction histidine kinase
MKMSELVPEEDIEPKRVLVVDDEKIERVLARTALEANGFQVRDISSGEEALQLFSDYLPDLVLLDVVMPGLDGFQVCEHIRSAPCGKDTPIVMFTGLDKQESIDRAYEAGATDFASKPVNWSVLTKRLRYILRTQDLRRYDRDTRRRTQALLDAIPDRIYRIRKDGTFLDYRSRDDEEQGTGDEDTYVSRTFEDVFPNHVSEQWRAHLNLILETGQHQVFEYTLGDGDPQQDLEARLVVSGPEEVIVLIRDKTEQNRVEEELRQSQKMEALGLLAGGVAHDFNNTLTVINCSASLLARKTQEDPSIQKRVQSILSASEHATALTEQLLAFTRKKIHKPQSLLLNSVIKGSRDMLGRLIGEDVRLVTDLQENLWHIAADPSQIQQVLMNLAVNARDAMPTGGTLSLQTRNVVAKSEDRTQSPGRECQGSVVLEVKDTGCGMDRKTVKRIFEPFFTTKEKTGTGLGLSTVFGIVQQLGGTIQAQSEQGKGSVFRIGFPCIVNAGQDSAAGDNSTHDSSRARNETILVVEDEEEIRTLVCELLKEQGYFVISASNGEQALSIAKLYTKQIDLLLTDVVMPGLSGKVLADEVCKIRTGIKTLYMSGYPEDVTSRNGVSGIGRAFIPKPFRPAELWGRVQSVLEG